MADDLGAYVTLFDLAQETDNKEFIDVAAILTEKVPVFQDANWVEGNQKAAHKFGRDAELASGDIRNINDGIDATKGSVDQVVEPISLYEDRSIIDQELVKLAPNELEFRYRMDNMHLKGGANWIGDAILYGAMATAHPNYIDGFQPRYNLLADANVWGNGDATATSVTSAYIIGWGPDKVSFLYPANGRTDILSREDLGKQLVTGKNSKQLVAWVTEFYFRYGIMVMDHRYVQRICNIGTTTVKHLDPDLVIEARNNMPDTERAAMYVNKKVYTQLCITAKNMGEHILHWVKIDGKADVLYWQDMPIRKWDSIKITEAVVV